MHPSGGEGSSGGILDYLGLRKVLKGVANERERNAGDPLPPEAVAAVPPELLAPNPFPQFEPIDLGGELTLQRAPNDTLAPGDMLLLSGFDPLAGRERSFRIFENGRLANVDRSAEYNYPVIQSLVGYLRARADERPAQADLLNSIALRLDGDWPEIRDQAFAHWGLPDLPDDGLEVVTQPTHPGHPDKPWIDFGTVTFVPGEDGSIAINNAEGKPFGRIAPDGTPTFQGRYEDWGFMRNAVTGNVNNGGIRLALRRSNLDEGTRRALTQISHAMDGSEDRMDAYVRSEASLGGSDMVLAELVAARGHLSYGACAYESCVEAVGNLLDADGNAIPNPFPGGSAVRDAVVDQVAYEFLERIRESVEAAEGDSADLTTVLDEVEPHYQAFERTVVALHAGAGGWKPSKDVRALGDAYRALRDRTGDL